ncbi:sporulation protein YqfD [Virgibacillus sp. C22-A2]|uniref:Sporulation protein YqfD n=1 Tax=Virgibacillus tibetensis TaxID=3042313 RepID=A0ABU6KA62_9BACI|nr:sporulation protein YqfD [Virgibacillus sp. C22-A2]
MKQIQGAFITGYVTISVKGSNPELFFQKCIHSGLTIWDVKKTADDTCTGNIKLKDIKVIRQIKRNSNYKITFVGKKGYPFTVKLFLRKKQLVVGLIMSILLIIFLSNIIWEVKITGVPKEIEEKISKQLESYGIHPGSWIITLESPNSIQQKLVKDVPELLWVGVHQKGTTFFLEGVEKIIVNKEEVKGPRNLVATKKGIIKTMYVSKGLPKVHVNDFVEPGDVLVSGIINESEETDEDEDSESGNKNLELVAAAGEITATTWYEVLVTIPLEASYEHLTGNQEKKHYIRIGSVRAPLWGFGEPDYKNIHSEVVERELNFFKWKLPVKIGETILSEKMYTKVERSREEAINTGIQQAKEDLKLELGQEARILSEKVLHDTIENGKVKLSLYISVEENISEEQPISKSLEK